MDKWDMLLILIVLLVGVITGLAIAPEPCSYPPFPRNVPFEQPGIGG
jgi:hypothetical protein